MQQDKYVLKDQENRTNIVTSLGSWRDRLGVELLPHQLNGTTNMIPKKKKRKKNKKTTTPK